MTQDQLVELLNLRDDKIKQLEDEILELKRGYIYIVQFENNVEQSIFKCGKTRNGQLENRFGVYKTNDSPEHGDMEVLRVTAVNDYLEAERYMHNLIRQNCKCADNHSKKSKDKNEWYIDDCKMFYIGLDIKTPTKQNLYSLRNDTEKYATSQVK